MLSKVFSETGIGRTIVRADYDHGGGEGRRIHRRRGDILRRQLARPARRRRRYWNSEIAARFDQFLGRVGSRRVGL